MAVFWQNLSQFGPWLFLVDRVEFRIEILRLVLKLVSIKGALPYVRINTTESLASSHNIPGDPQKSTPFLDVNISAP